MGKNPNPINHELFVVYCPDDEEYGGPLFDKGAVFGKQEVLNVENSPFIGMIVRHKGEYYEIIEGGWKKLTSRNKKLLRLLRTE